MALPFSCISYSVFVSSSFSVVIDYLFHGPVVLFFSLCFCFYLSVYLCVLLCPVLSVWLPICLGLLVCVLVCIMAFHDCFFLRVSILPPGCLCPLCCLCPPCFSCSQSLQLVLRKDCDQAALNCLPAYYSFTILFYFSDVLTCSWFVGIRLGGTDRDEFRVGGFGELRHTSQIQELWLCSG